jgi:hypothetical protein
MSLRRHISCDAAVPDLSVVFADYPSGASRFGVA